jgi:Na+/melibiose symporter-like transporter
MKTGEPSFFSINSLAAVVAVLLASKSIVSFGCKKRAYIILNLLFAVVLIWFYFIPLDNFPSHDCEPVADRLCRRTR